jgi:hypothetical protein
MNSRESRTNSEIGTRFGRWIILEGVGRVGKSQAYHYKVRCECGTEKIVKRASLITKRSQSCGCFHKDLISLKAKRQGMSTTVLYNTWWHMLDRCNNPSNAAYKNYGGRGIKVDHRWNDFNKFVEDMSPHPGSEYSLDRIDNNGNYEPGNCRWSTRKEQNRNTRTNRILEYNNKKQCVKSWADELGLKPSTILKRLERGWSLSDTLSPVKFKRINK